jgi:nucleoside-diphosphate-sugar epimerase
MLILLRSTGFIGSQICRALAGRGEQVRAFHRPSSSLAALEGLEVEHALGDLEQPETLAAAMQGVEAVFHTAAKVGLREKSDFKTVTVIGTRAVLEAARAAGVRRVVHTSSVAALGVPDRGSDDLSPIPMNEQHTWNYRPEWWRTATPNTWPSWSAAGSSAGWRL